MIQDTVPTAEPLVPIEEAAPARQALRVLIVDDEALTILMLRRALEKAGYEVVGQAADGEAGIALAREMRPNLILMDCSMPGMDGIEATKRIMKERPVPIIMLTGYSEEDFVNRAIEAGATTYLVKPVNSLRLFPAIQTAFDIFKTAYY